MAKGCELSTGYLPRGGLPRNSVDRITDCPDMTSVTVDVKHQPKQTKQNLPESEQSISLASFPNSSSDIRSGRDFDTDCADPDCPRKNEKAKKFWSFVKSLKKDAFGINSLRVATRGHFF